MSDTESIDPRARLPADVLSAIGRHLAQQRQRVASRCTVCGVQIEGLKMRRYCSNACRQRAKRQRHRIAKSR